ncbi:MAG: PSD1 and planctomycete cytochrome C domain-containing protein [Acidobacteriota bacterium]
MLKKLKAFATLVVIGFFLIVSLRSARTAGLQQPEPSREGLEFFEKKIRPVLAENCYGCHSDRGKKPQGDLRIDMIESLLRGGTSGKPAIKPGDPDNSLLIIAVRQTDAKLQMPPGDKLTPEQIKDLEQWIKMGAPAPKDKNTAVAVTSYDWNEAKKFWSFQPVKDQPPPQIKNAAWVRSPIDRFILAKLEEKELKPFGDADRVTLIRRATFDLTGLPPTPGEIDEFLADRSPNAFEKVVDRLLASPAYGEKWGRHWLDVVRYADTAGDNSDYPVPSAYRYRNYVIESFNKDKPYDQFIREQIAGDLLPALSKEGNDKEKYEKIIATGYLAMSRRFGSRNENMNLTIDDTIDNLGKAFLGLSTSCARCHDHKFDPIPTKDYYALYGIFNSSRYAFPGAEIYKHPAEYVVLASGEKAAKFYRQQQELNDLDDRHEFLVAEKGTAARNKKAKEQAAKEAAQPVAATTGKEEKKAETAKSNNQAQAEQSNDKPAPQKPESKPELIKTTLTGYPLRPADFNRDADNWGRAGQSKRMPDENDAELKRVNARIQEQHMQMAKVDKAYAVVEGLPNNARVHRKGDLKNLGEEAPRGFLTILGGQKLPEGYAGSGRDELARWIAGKQNPLTARVMANRIWQYHFGKGIVQTPNDFGTRGKAPTHPELLDWLATHFVEGGWSIKKMHKLMMLSHVYQLASAEATGRITTANEKIDVGNDYLWRFNRRRLEAEEIRDAILATAGTLDRTIGGEHPFPAETTWRFTQHEQFFATYDTNRRSVYLMQQRLKKHPFFEVFDGADQSATTDVRGQSITPVQALFLMNSPMMHEQSDQLAVRVGMAFDTVRERIDYAFRLAYGRTATLMEIKEATAYLQQVRQELMTAGTPAEKLNRAALASYLRVVLGSNDFLYVD